MINADKPEIWDADILESVKLFNEWYLTFAPLAFRAARDLAAGKVETAFDVTSNLQAVNGPVLAAHPEVLPVLRMCTCPPIARDRLIGLSGANSSLVGRMEKLGKIALRMPETELDRQLHLITDTIHRMLDADLFPWLAQGNPPTRAARRRASIVIADRLCAADADPVIRNAQEQRQLDQVAQYLRDRGYRQITPGMRPASREMAPGTFAFRWNVVAIDVHQVNIPIDVVVQPKQSARGTIPILIEAKSAGDFTNVNKRRKEEVTKFRYLRSTYGPDVRYLLFLCGYFDRGYLAYEAAAGIDWVWEHRISDFDALEL